MTEIFLDKLIRLWPVMAFNVFINVFFFHMRSEDAIFQLPFLHCTGISLNYRGFIWYVAPFFWSTMIIIGIVRSFERNRSIILLGFIMWLGYSVNINYLSGVLGRETVFGFLSLGFIRVFAGLTLGYITTCFIEEFKRCFGKCTLNYYVKTFICSIIEITAFVTLFKKFVFGKGKWSNAFIIEIIFTVLFCSFVNRSGLLSRVFDKRVLGLFGKYTYSIYVMQQIALEILERTFWKNTVFLVTHVYTSLFVSVLFVVGMGICTYYIVERPSILFYKRWKNSGIEGSVQ